MFLFSFVVMVCFLFVKGGAYIPRNMGVELLE